MRQGFREDGLLLKVGAQQNTISSLQIVVSKKVAKQAVRRNRIRRVLREAAARETEFMKARQNLVLIVLPGFELPSFAEAQERIRLLFRKASLLP